MTKWITLNKSWTIAVGGMIFQFGWFTDPVLLGDYPQEMKDVLGDRLPESTLDERNLLCGTANFVGLNHYSTLDASVPTTEPDYDGYWADIHVNFTSRPEWPKTDMGWSVVPDGCQELLLWIHCRYDRPTLVMTKNGVRSANRIFKRRSTTSLSIVLGRGGTISIRSM